MTEEERGDKRVRGGKEVKREYKEELGVEGRESAWKVMRG